MSALARTYDTDCYTRAANEDCINGGLRTRTKYKYDAAHRLTDINDGLGNHVHFTLDAMGNRTAENVYDPSNVLSRTHTRVFNTLSELYQDIGATSATTTLGYDGNGNQTSSSAPLSRNTASLFDALNRPSQITDPASGITHINYDANDNVSTVTDPATLVTGYTHNGFGDTTQVVSPSTGTTVNTFDSGGNLQTVTDARSALATYVYDALDRVTSAAYQVGGVSDPTISYSYDVGTNGKGHLTGASDANHSLAWSYDALGRVTGRGQTAGGVTLGIGYAYTNNDLTTITTPSGQTLTYAYANHQVTGITANSTALLTNASYEPFGPVRGWTWGNATSEVHGHNTDGNPNQLTGAESISLSYDNGYRVNGITNSSNPSLSWTDGYDSLDRLTSAVQSGTSLGWTYYPDGDRNQQTGAATPSPLWTSGASFAYNARGRMSSAAVAGATTNYTYNALGQMIQKTGGTTTLLMYDEKGHLLGEYTGSGGLIQETVWLGDTPVATLRPNGGSSVSINYVHADQLNAPRAITRPSDNSVLWRWDADPFGTALANQNPQGVGTFVYNLRFPGQYYQSETGLNYNYFRDYDPQAGRYIESDPIGLGSGINTYAYALDNPVGAVDTTGENAIAIPVVVGSALVVGCAIIPSCAQKLSDALNNVLNAEGGGGNASTPPPYSHADENDALAFSPDPFGGKEECERLAYAIKVLRALRDWRKTDLNSDSMGYIGHLQRIAVINKTLSKLEEAHRNICGGDCPK